MNRRDKGTGSIFFERASQRYVGILDLGADATGKRRRRRVSGNTRAEVRVKLDALRHDAEKGLPVTPGSLTVGDVLTSWLEEVLPVRARVKSSNTVDNYRWAIERHIRPALGARRLRELTPDDVERMLRDRATAGMAKNSLVRLRSVAVMALRYAQRRDLVSRNVAELAEMPADARPATEGRSLTAEQAAKLLEAAANDRLGALVVTGLMIGLRPGELSGLRWCDVDLDAGVVHVRQSCRRERDEDGRERLVFGEPKTPKSRRSIALPSPVRSALQRQRAQQSADRLVAGPRWVDHGLVFSSETGTPLNPSNLRKAFSRLTRAAGLGDWHPNELRHSAASLLSAAGVPQELVADVLGHADTRMLHKHYRHAVAPSVVAAVAPMESLFGSA